jgi:hypothetical protein
MNAQVNFGSGGCYKRGEWMKRVYVHVGEVNIYTNEVVGIELGYHQDRSAGNTLHRESRLRAPDFNKC